MSVTVHEVDEFLNFVQRDRQWLASELGCSKGTLNNWMSAGRFPEWADKSLERLMRELRGQLVPDEGSLSFTPKEWAMIQRAMELSGAKSFEEFFRFAVAEKLREIAKQDEAKK